MDWTKTAQADRAVPASYRSAFGLVCLFQMAISGCNNDRGDGVSSGASGLASAGSGVSDGSGSASAEGDGSGADSTGMTGGGSGSPSDPSDAGDVDSDPSSASASDDGTIFDVNGGVSAGDDGVTPAGGCRIDFLFVIDSSCSMGNDQDNIDASLSGFVSTIETRFGDHDHHIMIVDTDELNFDEWTACRTTCAFGLTPTCGTIPCSALPPDDMCNSKLGVGLNSNRVSCNFLGGNRYIIDGQPDLNATFHCAAGNRKDTGLTDEKAAGALLGAISPEMNAPGGCNAGFMRRDAILVVTMITDEEDDPNDHVTKRAMDTDVNSVGDPASWKQAVVDIKNGDETAVVILGLLGNPDLVTGTSWCPPLLLDEDGEKTGIEGAEETHRLRQFSESFPNGMWAGICEPNYAPFFDQAVSVIDTACKEFVPPPPE